MFGGHRSIVLAACGVALAANQAPDKSANTKQEQAAESERKATPTAFTPPANPPEAVEPPEYYKPCGERGSEGNSDLCAQWTAAKAAEDAALWAWWQMWLSALGVIGLGATLWFNFRALSLAEKESEETKGALVTAQRNASSASRAASAASEANAIARESMQRQLRPFVYVAHPHITYHHMPSFDFVGDNAEVILYITNFGQTPAYNVQLIARSFVGGIWNAPFESNFDDLVPVFLGDIPPTVKKPRDGYTVLGIEKAHRDIQRGTASVFVEGVINYADIFGTRYVTQFRFASTGGDYHNQKWADCPEGNAAT